MRRPATRIRAVLYIGDFNMSGTARGNLRFAIGLRLPNYDRQCAFPQGRAIDPLNANPQDNNQTWELNPAFAPIMTVSSTSVRYRDDLQLMTQNIYSSAGPFASALFAGLASRVWQQWIGGSVRQREFFGQYGAR